MYYDYRVVKLSDDIHAVCEVHYDSNKNPIQCGDPLTITGSTPADISTMLVYANRALTEPVLDVRMFNTNSSDSTNQALDILRGLK